jgi:undecaprenyl-phosphate 4-deoxy-4-formamido-L-arabinose transferase
MTNPIQISIVIPVYQGEKTLPKLVGELNSYHQAQTTKLGHLYTISEVILVHDCGADRSDKIIEELSERYPIVRPIWLSRNFGQHPATMAGMASATGDWIVTLDEDGQQDPAFISGILDEAISKSLQVVYALPTNPPPHGWLRNAFSKLAKSIFQKLSGNVMAKYFNSFRMIDGEIARTLAAYSGNGIFLDVGLLWVSSRIGSFPVELRDEDRPSGYSYSKLMSHFWRLILISGTRPLRLITLLGVFSLMIAFMTSLIALYGKILGNVPVKGWTSLFIIISFFSGAIMLSLGIVAEYLAVTMSIAMGKPLYVISTKPSRPPKTVR